MTPSTTTDKPRVQCGRIAAAVHQEFVSDPFGKALSELRRIDAEQREAYDNFMTASREAREAFDNAIAQLGAD